MRWMFSLFLMIGLAACGGGGGGGGGAGIDPRLARLDAYDAQALRVLGDPDTGALGLPLTGAGNLPPMGGFTLSGFATIRIEDANDPRVLYGDAALTLDYDTDQASGTLESFFGVDGADVVADYSGSIAIFGAAPAQGGMLSYAGTLVSPAATLALSGDVEVHLLGEVFSAVAAADLDASMAVNGSSYGGTLVIVAETDPP